MRQGAHCDLFMKYQINKLVYIEAGDEGFHRCLEPYRSRRNIQCSVIN